MTTQDWNPTTHPYRVTTLAPSGGTYASRRFPRVVGTYATKREAWEAFQAAEKAAPRNVVEVSLALNGETWVRNGGWKTVHSSKKAR